MRATVATAGLPMALALRVATVSGACLRRWPPAFHPRATARFSPGRRPSYCALQPPLQAAQVAMAVRVATPGGLALRAAMVRKREAG